MNQSQRYCILQKVKKPKQNKTVRCALLLLTVIRHFYIFLWRLELYWSMYCLSGTVDMDTF